MSGDGAEYLAQAGASAEDILQWWYSGVELTTF
jgi:peptidoglycan hydrolase-like amidase